MTTATASAPPAETPTSVSRLVLAVARWWYLVALGLAVTAVAVVLVRQSAVIDHVATGSLLVTRGVVLDQAGEGVNPYDNYGATLNVTAGAVAEVVSSPGTRNAILLAGGTDEYAVTLDPERPIVRVEAVDPDPLVAIFTAKSVLEEVADVLAERQSVLEIPAGRLLRAEALAVPTEAEPLGAGLTRQLIGLVVLGVGGSLGLAVTAEALTPLFAERRARRQARREARRRTRRQRRRGRGQRRGRRETAVTQVESDVATPQVSPRVGRVADRVVPSANPTPPLFGGGRPAPSPRRSVYDNEVPPGSAAQRKTQGAPAARSAAGTAASISRETPPARPVQAPSAANDRAETPPTRRADVPVVIDAPSAGRVKVTDGGVTVTEDGAVVRRRVATVTVPERAQAPAHPPATRRRRPRSTITAGEQEMIDVHWEHR